MDNLAERLRGAGARAGLMCAALAAFGAATPASAQLYIEGNAGFAIGNYGENKPTDPLTADQLFQSRAPHGMEGGLGFGYDLRLGNFVVGPNLKIEDGGVTDSKIVCDASGCGSFEVLTDRVAVKWTGSARLEAGYVVADHLMFTGAFGWARGEADEQRVTTSPGPPKGYKLDSIGLVGDGPVWDVGVEWLLDPHMSMGFRYEETRLDFTSSHLIGTGTKAKLMTDGILLDVRWYPWN